ncbi:Uncharacterised protein [Pantoea agglomerans]|uniref:Uncharacterized protein n=1 Tax=Enterobacter agglomerans TaxID=549 RepID=A0A379AFU5_ENTAG|nr:Uncharacterised protein [Pantoea agglomerans]
MSRVKTTEKIVTVIKAAAGGNLANQTILGAQQIFCLTELQLTQVMTDSHPGLLTEKLPQRPFAELVQLTKLREIKGAGNRTL